MSLIFRKKALEKLNNPNQLDTLIQVIPKYAWISLFNLILLMTVIFLWLCFGQITSSIKMQGVFYPTDNSEHKTLKVYSFVDNDIAKKITKNTIALIAINEEHFQKYVNILGKVTDIVPYQEIQLSPNKNNIDAFLSQRILNSRYKIIITPSATKDNLEHYSTSSGLIYEKRIDPNTTCEIQLILKKNTPIHIVAPFLFHEDLGY